MKVVLNKVLRIAKRKADAELGRLYPLNRTLSAMSVRPFELHLELTNLCNADCVFCPYQYQERPHEFMSDLVFEKAVNDYLAIGGGSVGLTPIVGDALIHPKFLEYVCYLRSFDEIDRIFMVNNGILLDKFGVAEVLDSGMSSITISTAGFEEAMYERVYRSHSYQRMKRNVTELFRLNAERSVPINLVVALRADRPLKDVMNDADFQPILKYDPQIDYVWAFSSAGGRITSLPKSMKMRSLSRPKETCVQLYNGPTVLPDGTVIACSCLAAMDAATDLGIGNVKDATLLSIWQSHAMKQLRDSFRNPGSLNPTCAKCDIYRNLELYRTREGRERGRVNLARHNGENVRRAAPSGPFVGG